MNANHTRSNPQPVNAVQWCPSGNPGDGVPSEIVRLLARADGKTYGYGHGPGWSTVFGSEQGDITVLPGQWVIRHDDGRIEVTGTAPQGHSRAGEGP